MRSHKGGADSKEGVMAGEIRIVRVEKKQGSLGFCIKGGKEHGIPIVVSEIEKNGPKNIHLGDELVYVNEASLQGATHMEAVHKLRNSKGPTVLLRIRPNRILQDTFLSPNKSDIIRSPTGGKPTTADWWAVPDDNPRPLPQGWGRKVDYKSGKPYFENHLTNTTTWTDPRTLSSVPIDEFNWRGLPPGWERFVDNHGDVYYVNHDTQSTHWDSPRGMRQLVQLGEMETFMEKETDKLKDMVDDLTDKRTKLLSKNQKLEGLHQQEQGGDVEEGSEEEEMGGASRKSDLVEDIMFLNEEIEEMDKFAREQRKNIQKLKDVLWKAQSEEIGDIDQYKCSLELAFELKEQLKSLKEMERETRETIHSLETMRGPEDTPISYMLQLTPSKKKDRHGNDDEREFDRVHLLGDRLTGKTNCEMRVELLVLDNAMSHANHMTRRVLEVWQWVEETRKGFDWDNVTDQLLDLDLSVFNTDWIQGDSLREKLELVMK